MLDIKKEEKVVKKSIYKVGLYLTTTEIMKIIECLTMNGKNWVLAEQLTKIHKNALHQINEDELIIEADVEEKARTGKSCKAGCE